MVSNIHRYLSPMRLILIIFTTVFNICATHSQSALNTAPVWLKLSPGTLLFLDKSEDKWLFPRDTDNRISALIQVTKADIQLPTKIQVTGNYGYIKSARLSIDDIKLLLSYEDVQYIDISWRLNRMKYYSDTSRILSKVDLVHQGLSNGLQDNYSGTGTIVGIVDIGFQSDNPNFYKMDGSQTRIKRWWHQSDKSGVSPAGYGYGSEFSAISSILNGRDDDGFHGTHVGGIAAGSGYTTPGLKYRGMAPDADLVFVTIKYGNDSLGGSGLGDYIVGNPSILDGFDYIFKYAKSVNKPAVCNLSWGMHTGPHDGNSLFDKAIESLTGDGKIICGSAGNDGGNELHISGNLNNDTVYTFAVDRSRRDYKNENVYFDVWGAEGKQIGINISIFDTLGNFIVASPFSYSNQGYIYKKLISKGTDSFWYTITANPAFVNNGKPEITAIVETNNSQKLRIRVGFTGEGVFHAWNSGQAYRWTSGSFLSSVKGNNYSGKYLSGTQQYSVVENGGTGKSMITAGSYVARKEWTDFNGKYHAHNWLNVGEISGFSSRGPTVDGRIKPDICSPGQNIVSSANYRTFAGWMEENSPFKSSFLGKDQYWTLASGTSMAAPNVAGIVALLLQVNPKASVSEIRDVIQSTAIRDNFTGTDSNMNYGYGKINAYAAVKKMIQLSVEKAENPLNGTLFPVPAVDFFSFAIPVFAGKTGHFKIFDQSGKLIQSGVSLFNDWGIAVIDIHSITQGCYTVAVSSLNMRFTGKLLIQH